VKIALRYRGPAMPGTVPGSSGTGGDDPGTVAVAADVTVAVAADVTVAVAIGPKD